MYILVECRDIFIKCTEREEENRVDRCRLQRISTICCSACAYFWQVPSLLTLSEQWFLTWTQWLSQQTCLWLPGAPKSSAASLICHIFSLYLYFLFLSFGGIASTFLSMLDQSRIIHLGPFWPYWLSDDMSPSPDLNCGPDGRKLCSLTNYWLSFS